MYWLLVPREEGKAEPVRRRDRMGRRLGRHAVNNVRMCVNVGCRRSIPETIAMLLSVIVQTET